MNSELKTLTLVTEPSADYELIDSGNGEKLERWGDIVLARPDPQALWAKSQPEKWEDADAVFIREGKSAKWDVKTELPKSWEVEFGGFTFIIRATSFKHTGLFPEHLANWEWMAKKIRNQISKINSGNSEAKIHVLNLFGYTGGASLACAKAGAEVVHLDGSKASIEWGKENAKASGLEDKPIRWILDDARTFLKREVKRGNKYDAIIMDPPAFGYGPNDELWKIEEHFTELLDLCKQVLSEYPLFVIINGYASGYSAIGYANNLEMMMERHAGSIEMGELSIRESNTQRLLPCGIFARWQTE